MVLNEGTVGLDTVQQNPRTQLNDQPVTPVTREAEAGELKVHNRLWIQSKFKANLGN